MQVNALRPVVTTAIAIVILLLAAPVAAEPHTTSDLLLPYFEIDLPNGRSTLFAIGNVSDDTVEVRVTVASNWGIPVLATNLELEPAMVKTVNLADWIVRGELPARTLGPAQLAHVQAALSGQPSPDDGLYYGTEVEADLAVGSVTMRLLGGGGARPDILWGDYFWVDPQGNLAEGEVLADIDQARQCRGLCDRHVLRFLEGGAFDGGTELIIWVDRPSVPRPSPDPILTPMTMSGSAYYTEPGVRFDERVIELLATQALPLRDLLLSEPFGWLDMITEEVSYIGVRYRAENRFGVGLQTWCVEEPPSPPSPPARRPGIEIQKFTNGVDADQPTGPILRIGSPVTWEYRVTNTGNTRLTGVAVTDNRGVAVSCPRSTLERGAQMTCTAGGTVLPGQYSNIGTVTGNPPDGAPVTDSDPSHYLGVEFVVGEPAVDIEKLTNGQDADTPTGPTLTEGSPVTWSYLVTNTGGVGLTDVTVTDDQGVAVSCPKATLAIGASMICSASGTAEVGQYANIGTVSADGDGETVTDSDPSHYYGVPVGDLDEPAIEIEKLTNGYDADSLDAAPHLPHGHALLWSYIVTNTGNVALSNVDVTDSKGVQVSCPKTTLDAGESMVCTGSGTAVAAEECYGNIGLVEGTPPEGDVVTDSDPSHYCGFEVVGEPAIHIEKYTNGYDADMAPGPTLTEGDNVQWVYVVTNVGDVTLTSVTVADDQGLMITCDGVSLPFVLDPGEQVICFANGLAEVGQYANIGSTQGVPQGGGDPVTDDDPSHYFGEELVAEPGIDIEKATNGEDADEGPGPSIAPGAPVVWTYVVTNTGNVALTDVTVTDDQGVFVFCPKDVLDPGESMTCTGLGTAVEGDYVNIGSVTALPPAGPPVAIDSDPSHYTGEEMVIGDEGCTPGYWKNHTDSWPPTGYSTGQTVSSVFAQAAAYATVGPVTLLEALDLAGGPGVDGAAQILARASVAALLNASHSGVEYQFSVVWVLTQVDTALASGDRDTMLAVANTLDAANNQGCPLN